MVKPDGRPILSFADQAAWRAWLAEHHATTDAGVWIRLLRKKAGEGLTQRQAVEEALCFGWIDGRGGSDDAAHVLQSFTPRRSRSKWSQINRDWVAALITAGRMQPAGQAEIDRAKADGRWAAAYAPPSRIETPDDLVEALAVNPRAKAAFEALDSRNRYAVLYRTADAKRPETRAKRIAGFVDMLARGEVIYSRKG